MSCPQGFSYLFPPKKEAEDIDKLKEKTKKKISDLKKEKSKLEKSKDKIDVDLLKKLVDEFQEDEEDKDDEDEDEDEEEEEQLSPLIVLLEQMKKKNNQPMFNYKLIT